MNDKFVVDKAGNVTLAGNINMTDGVITWGSNGPVKYQFSAAGVNGPWHDAYAANDKYRRDSVDGGTTWGEGYQFVGVDGKPGANGSDASVTFNNIKSALSKAHGTQTSFMTVDEMGAPEIYGGKIYGAEIYAGGVGEKGGRVIGLTSGGIDIFSGTGENVLTIAGAGDGAKLSTGYNYMTIETPHLNLNGEHTYFRGSFVDFTPAVMVDFTGVETRGLHATFA